MKRRRETWRRKERIEGETYLNTDIHLPVGFHRIWVQRDVFETLLREAGYQPLGRDESPGAP